MSIAAIEKAASAKGKRAAKAKNILVAVRTELRTGNTITRTPWRILRDDPKNGVYERRNWVKKFGISTRRVTKEKPHWSVVTIKSGDKTKAEARAEALRRFPELTDAQYKELNRVNADKKLNGLYRQMADGLINCGSLQYSELDDFMEFMHDENHRKIAVFNPKHPPRFIPVDPSMTKSAMLETFLWHTAQRSSVNYLRNRKSDACSGNFRKVSITSASKEEAERIGAISAEVMVDDRQSTIRMIEFDHDYNVLRTVLPSDLHRIILDALLLEKTDTEIVEELKLVFHTFKYKLKSRIQIIADLLGFEPSDEDAFIDKLYSVRRKLRRHREAREQAERDAANNQNGVKQ